MGKNWFRLAIHDFIYFIKPVAKIFAYYLITANAKIGVAALIQLGCSIFTKKDSRLD